MWRMNESLSRGSSDLSAQAFLVGGGADRGCHYRASAGAKAQDRFILCECGPAFAVAREIEETLQPAWHIAGETWVIRVPNCVMIPSATASSSMKPATERLPAALMKRSERPAS